jgi:hypothetical protein
MFQERICVRALPLGKRRSGELTPGLAFYGPIRAILFTIAECYLATPVLYVVGANAISSTRHREHLESNTKGCNLNVQLQNKQTLDIHVAPKTK